MVAGPVDPQTIWFLSEKGVDISPQPSKSVEQIPQFEQVQVVVALTKTAEKVFPQRPTKALTLQWFVPDPSKARGRPEDVRAEYERAYLALSNHVRDLVEAILDDGQQIQNDDFHPTI